MDVDMDPPSGVRVKFFKFINGCPYAITDFSEDGLIANNELHVDTTISSLRFDN